MPPTPSSRPSSAAAAGRSRSQADVAHRSRRRPAVRDLRRASSARSTALVNNAGILETQMRVEAMDAARLQRVFATNVVGSFLCAREAVRRMSTRHGGRGGAIVNLSSARRPPRRARRVRRLRRLEGRDRHLHHRPGAGSRAGRHPRQRRARRASSTPRCTPAAASRARRSREGVRADAPRRTARRSGAAPSCGCSPTRRASPPARSST